MSRDGSSQSKLFWNIHGFFKRCLTQQVTVRTYLLDGFRDIYDRCPSVRGGILDIIFPHFEMYYESNESFLCPLNLETAVSSTTCSIVEYLPVLISTLLYCITDDNDENVQTTYTSYKSIVKTINTMKNRLVLCELEDMEFQSSSTFDKNTSEGRRNGIKSTLMLGIFEAFMHSEVLANNVTQVMMWFQKYTTLKNLVSSKSSSSSGGKKKQGGGGGSVMSDEMSTLPASNEVDKLYLTYPMITTSSLLPMLNGLYGNSPWSAVEQCVNAFAAFVLNQCMQFLDNKQVSPYTYCKNAE